jgi:alanine racemase
VVNPKAVAHTIVEIRKGVGARRGIMAVVKADGYGHGAVKVSLTALKKGANCLGVAIPEEARPFREAGIEVPILVLGSDDTKSCVQLERGYRGFMWNDRKGEALWQEY